ncbi:undecaprenyl-phosphate glucose phosphotransferase [Thiocapsa imhoffii]|uniref:Undecaprenyl-phosphate glucose phosphotransferase n=1 Tax=Thiocapsa imhoffii TaxID=382777 RepID=A0A9X0WJH7_9GAMM|nr:undecaprenyl-phosphate glucose phosphotransferase [Thiocapsa imhoffii]
MDPNELSARLFRRIAMMEPGATKPDIAEDPNIAAGIHHLSPQALAVAERSRTPTISASLFSGTTRLLDAVIVAATGALSLLISAGPVFMTPWAMLTILVGVVLVTVTFQAADCYQVPIIRSFGNQLLRVTLALAMIFGGLTAVQLLGSFGTGLPRHWLSLWFGTATLLLLLFRTSAALLAKHWTETGRLGHRAVVVAGHASIEEVIRNIERQPGSPIRICGIFDDRGPERTPTMVAGYPTLGSVSDLIEFARIAHVDMVVVTIPINAEDRLLRILKKLWVLPVDIRLAAHTDTLDFRDRASSYTGSLPFVDVVEKPLADWDAIAKRGIDLLFTSIALLLLFPVMLLTAIAIRLDSPGPVFFRQKRYGFNNEVIEVLKFRSMYHDQADPLAKQVVTKGDSRVTRVGRFIRKTSIDELPQLFNVLTGELSLVGPRPHAINAHTEDRLWEQVVEGYFARHKVKPGITGWAQVNGWRGEVDSVYKIHKRVEYDIYYIENWSILFDLYIMFRTPFALLNTENAY